MGSATVTLRGFEDISSAFAKASYLDKELFAGFVGEQAMAVTEQSFADETDPVTGVKWKKLSPVTQTLYGDSITEKRALLVRRGQLKRSIGYTVYPDGSVLQGSNKVYSRIHQEGGKTGRGRKVTMPPRRFLGPDPAFYTRIFADGAVRQLLGFVE